MARTACRAIRVNDQSRRRFRIAVVVMLIAFALLVTKQATAGEVTLFNDDNQGGDVTCPCFIVGEEAGAWFTAPCDGNIIAVQIGWGSQFGGQPDSLEQAIHIYEAGVFPAPGPEITTGPLDMSGPVLVDGFINEFGVPGTGIPVTAGQQFVVTLEFANENAGQLFAPSMVHDNAGCIAGQSVVKAIPGGWFDSCNLGVNGQWVVRAIISGADCGSGACCLPTGACVDPRTQIECEGSGGVYQGDDTTCLGVDCDPEGACCVESTGGCIPNLIQDDCEAIGTAVWQGPDTDCATIICFPKGACCLLDGTCVDDNGNGISPETCATLGGTFQGDETDCATITCPDPEGACCLDTGNCLVFTEDICVNAAGGTWAGPGTDCSDVDMNGTADVCECTQSTCPGDVVVNGVIDTDDFLAVLSGWGTCAAPCPPCCPADATADCTVNTDDFLAVLGGWGPCPP